MLKHLIKQVFGNFFIIFISVFIVQSISLSQEEPSHNRLEYEVSVSAQLIPVFAVDDHGEPVYDLKQEELRLFINGNPGKILYFNAFQLETEEQDESSPDAASNQAGQPDAAAVPHHPERLIFIILDGMISNFNKLDASRMLAKEIIRKAPPGDAFLIMETSGTKGFQHIIGPEKDKEKLYRMLSNRKNAKSGMSVRSSSIIEMARQPLGRGGGAEAEQSILFSLAVNEQKRAEERYQRQLSSFSTGMSRLKHALKSTNLPKNLYLLAPGVNTAGLGNMPVTALRNLEEAAKSVNYGGSLFYLVNPIPRKKEGKDWGKSLRFMADVAGGKYISGSSFEDIASKVTKSTSAYYELAFSNTVKPGKRSRIQLTCTRPGVRLTTIANTEKERPYSYMKNMERDLFVLNIINGGGWSRRLLKSIKFIDYKILSEETRKQKNIINLPKKNNYTNDYRFHTSPKRNRNALKAAKYIRKEIEITIPPAIQNKNAHIFRVEINDTTEVAKIMMSHKKVKQKLTLNFSCFEGMSYYVVLIDPQVPIGAYCKVE